jgi:hypothetical protein
MEEVLAVLGPSLPYVILVGGAIIVVEMSGGIGGVFEGLLKGAGEAGKDIVDPPYEGPTLAIGEACRRTKECSKTGSALGPSAGEFGAIGCCSGRCAFRRQNFKGQWRCFKHCRTGPNNKFGKKSSKPCKVSPEQKLYLRDVYNVATDEEVRDAIFMESQLKINKSLESRGLQTTSFGIADTQIIGDNGEITATGVKEDKTGRHSLIDRRLNGGLQDKITNQESIPLDTMFAMDSTKVSPKA